MRQPNFPCLCLFLVSDAWSLMFAPCSQLETLVLFTAETAAEQVAVQSRAWPALADCWLI